MRKILLMTSAVVLFPLSSIAQTTCTASPSCTSLGYTESSCPDGNGVKCPWGNKWFCPPKTEEDCVIGSIFYSDKTCSITPQDDKTPIGVVVYLDGNGGGQVIALNSIGEYRWGFHTNISGLSDLSDPREAIKDFDSCGNSDKIMADGSSSWYPAVWAAHEYSTEGTKAGDWCLPAAGIFYSMFYNGLDLINSSLIRINGFPFSRGRYEGDMWASTVLSAEMAWTSSFNDADYYGLKTNPYDGWDKYEDVADVRPVLEFQFQKKAECLLRFFHVL